MKLTMAAAAKIVAGDLVKRASIGGFDAGAGRGLGLRPELRNRGAGIWCRGCADAGPLLAGQPG